MSESHRLLILRREQQLQIALALDEFVLFRGTAFKNAHQMLDTRLPRCDNFPNANFIRDVADNRQALFVGFRGSGKIGIVRNDRLDFDEVHALLFERVHGGDRVGRSSDGDGTGEAQFAVRQISIQHGAGDDHARADDLAARDLFAPRHENRNVSAHIAHAGDTVGDEKRQDDVASAGKPIAESGVHVHVPQPRNEILTGGIDHSRVLRRLEFGRIGNGGDAIAGDNNGPIGSEPTTCPD